MSEISKNPNSEFENDPLMDILKISESTRRTERVCPACQKEKLSYDHFLNLTCPVCGYVEGNCFT